MFSRSGTSKKYPDFKSSTGYGTGAGLKGWNCRHDFFPYFEDMPRAYSDEKIQWLNNREVEYNGVKMTEYEASQKQRATERRIRASKRELAGYDAGIKASDSESLKEELQTAFNKKSVVLKRQEAALKDFCKQTGLRRDRAREQVSAHFDSDKGKTVAFDKSVSQKAVWANKQELKFREEQRIIIEKTRKDILAGKYPLEINAGHQNKHIKTSHSYISQGEKSYIYGDLETAKALVEKYHGTGEIKLNKKNIWVKKEFIDLDDDMGVVINPETGISEPTNRFAIHYGKKGTHIVPRERRKE